MCGRFTRYLSWSEIHRLCRLTAPAEIGRNDLVPPIQHCTDRDGAVCHMGRERRSQMRDGRWWLVPWWAKELPKQPMFNARVETVDTTNAFKDAFKNSRCLIPADGFYEWTKSPADGQRDPWHIFLPDHAPFSFAGLWAYNRPLDVVSCTIITMPPRQDHAAAT